MKQAPKHTPREIDKLGRMIGRVPYPRQADPALSDRIMARLSPLKPGVFTRIYLWSRTPKTFSLTPAFGLLALMLLVLPVAWIVRSHGVIPAPGGASRQVAGQVPVVLHFGDAGATSVAVIGTFNNWNPKGFEMNRNPTTGGWTLRMQVTPGRHDYAFLVDGKKVLTDPNADLNHKDEYGNDNSVLFVMDNHAQKI